MKHTIALATITLLACSCGSSDTESAEESSNDQNDQQTEESASADTDTLELDEKVSQAPAVELNPYYNDISSFISGKPVDESSDLHQYCSNPVFKAYAEQTEEKFEEFKTSKLSKIEPWVKKEINSIREESEVVFYPFSGPDFIYNYTFFPEADEYYLFGLEPVGKIPDVAKIGRDSLDLFYKSMNESIADNLNYSFFISNHMREDFSSAQVQGTLPVLLFFMSRMGLHVQDIAAVSVNDEGELVAESKDGLADFNAETHHGVEISFVRPDDQTRVSKLYYFNMDISNRGLGWHPKNEKFLESLPKNMTTFVKSCSYCLHEAKYSFMHDLILSHSAYLIQDDTGIPYVDINNDDWECTLYGKYDKPINMFHMHQQDDLKLAMEENSKHLPFRFGYVAESSLTVARRN